LGECSGRGVVDVVALLCPADGLGALEPDGSRAGGSGGLENGASAGSAQQVPGYLGRHGEECKIGMGIQEYVDERRQRTWCSSIYKAAAQSFLWAHA
jgi:hypothetical protein